MTAGPADSIALHLLRDVAPQVLGVVARRHGDFAAAEDAVQEAMISASAQWPVAGVPTNPRGWLYHVAMRRLNDYARSEAARRLREETVAIDRMIHAPFAPPADEDIGMEQDDTLVLLFMCCHPALTPPSAIALTLRAVGGLTTAEIAAAFLVPEATTAQRISRTKQSIKASNVSFIMPTEAERADLSNEAIRLVRALYALLPNDGEVTGLLALMILTDARRAARTGPNGELIPLDEQNRALWDQRLIAEGIELISGAMSKGSIGPYQLQAAIAAIHDEAAHVADTDWSQIFSLYGLLQRMSDNPMVALNRAIASAMVHGPAAGLELLKRLDDDSRIREHYRLDAVRGHLYEMSGNAREAIGHYRLAAERTMSIPERDYLLAKAARLAAAI